MKLLKTPIPRELYLYTCAILSYQKLTGKSEQFAHSKFNFVALLCNHTEHIGLEYLF